MRALSLFAVVGLLGCGAPRTRPLPTPPPPVPAEDSASEVTLSSPRIATEPDAPAPPEDRAPATRTGDTARWYASLRDDRSRRIADADRALAIATTEWLQSASIERFEATHDGYSYTLGGETTLCAFGPRERGASEREASRCLREARATEASVVRLRDAHGAPLDAYCLQWTEDGRAFAARWAPPDEGTRGRCPADVAPDAATRDGAFARPGEPVPVLEARPYLDAIPLTGGVAIVTSALVCLRDGAWTCVEHGPLGDGVAAIAPWAPGIWIVHRHRSDGTSYWSETEDALLAISLDAGGVTIHARMLTGIDYEAREDEAERMSGGAVIHAHTLRDGCVELGAPTRTGRGRRGRLPLAPPRIHDEERELGDVPDGLPLDDRRGAWILGDGAFERVAACPGDDLAR